MSQKEAAPGSVPSLEGWRFEVKMVCEERAQAQVIADLKAQPAGLRVLYPERWVQSIYFDTHEGAALQENLAGTSQREKLRLRWYGEDQSEVRGRLERKLRRNQLGRKEVLPLQDPFQVGGLDRLRFMRRLMAAIPPSGRVHLAPGLEPVQWIRYRRQYFGSFDGRLRVTVDRDLAACDLRDRWRVSWSRPSALPRLLIIECKAASQHEVEVRELLRGLRLQVGRCSKFVLATAASHGPLNSILEA